MPETKEERRQRIAEEDAEDYERRYGTTDTMSLPGFKRGKTPINPEGFAKKAPMFQMLPNIPQGRPLVSNGDGQNDFSMDKAMEAGSNANSYLGQKKAEDVANNLAAQTKVTYDSSTDLTTVQLPSWALTKYMGDALKYQDILSIYDKQISEKEARISQQNQHPWQNTLAQIAAHMAAEDPNPYTRGIGKAAVALNPSKDVLQGQVADLAGKAGQLQSQQLTRDLSMVEHEERLAEARTTHQERAKEFGLRTEEIATRNRELEREHKRQEQYRADALKETERHHKEWEKDYNLRTQEMALKKSSDKSAIDANRVQNTIMRGQSVISSINEKIEKAEESFRNYEKAVRDPKEPYKTEKEQNAAMDDLAYQKARLRIWTENQNLIKDQLYKQIQSLNTGIDGPKIPAEEKKYKAGSDPAGLGIQ